MTNKQLIKGWKKLSIKFKSGEVKPMTDMFLLCWGQTEMAFEDKKIRVVVFDQGGEQGNEGLFCQCDNDNVCWAFGWDSKKNTAVKSNIGKFIKNEKQ